MYAKNYPTRKAKVRKLTNQLLEIIVDINNELEKDYPHYNYVIDFCDEISDKIYDLKGLCYRRNYIE